MSFQYTEEQKKLKLQVRKFAEEKLAPIAPVVDTTAEISWDVIHLMAEEGLYRYVVPSQYGGVGIVPLVMGSAKPPVKAPLAAT